MDEVEQRCLATSCAYIKNRGSFQVEGRKMGSLPIQPFTEDDVKIFRMKFDNIFPDFQIIILMTGTKSPVPSC
jgi:hypothetical protein